MDSSDAGLTDSIGISGAAVGLDGFDFMEEELDDNYVPADEEIEEYARFLGMDIHEDRELFYIAKEGLKAPLPRSWRPCRSPGGTVWYYNFQTKTRQQAHPCDDHYRQLYLEEKELRRKREQDRADKKRIKQMQEMEKEQKRQEFNNIQQQVQMGLAGAGSRVPQPAPVVMNTVAAPLGAKGSIMKGPDQSYMAAMNDPLEVSASAVDQLVQFELDYFIEELEEKKIILSRQKQEELKNIEQERRNMKLKLQSDAERELDYLRSRLESERQTSTAY